MSGAFEHEHPIVAELNRLRQCAKETAPNAKYPSWFVSVEDAEPLAALLKLAGCVSIDPFSTVRVDSKHQDMFEEDTKRMLLIEETGSGTCYIYHNDILHAARLLWGYES